MKRIKKALTATWDFIISPFISVAVFLDEERRINEDGRYDEYWAKKNARAAKREARKQSRA